MYQHKEDSSYEDKDTPYSTISPVFIAHYHLCHCPGWQDSQGDYLLTIPRGQSAGRFLKL